ncbi:HlyD family secretion protein [Dyella sp.]|uniref:HlyD family secretion protein n=1 Tax=Dyella sp. TaxID=1869338 RepID=UPI002845B504|nr:HlyD family secretion protein [Dyella sp.]MDR3447531.1 HlyD family secretion protein [Dyella sp.]
MLNRPNRFTAIRDARAWAQRSPRALAGALACIALLFGGITYWCLVARYRESTDDAYVRADIVTVSPRVSGYLAQVLVQDNQDVKAGDVLARIDDSDYLARVALAQGAVDAADAELRGRRAAITNLDALTDEQTSHIAAAEADVAAQQAAAHKAALAYQRQQWLKQEQIASQEQLESAQAEAAMSASAQVQAQAALAGSRKRLVSLQTERAKAEAARDAGEADLAKARATLTLAQLDLDHTRIQAPSSGRVGQRSLRVGQYVAVGTPLLAIVPRDTYVVANFKETQLARVHLGQPVQVEVDALGGRHLHGRVESFSPASGAEFALLPPDNATGNFTKIVQRMPLRVALDAAEADALRPGMSVVATIDTQRTP